jgi:hypothetical protein
MLNGLPKEVQGVLIVASPLIASGLTLLVVRVLPMSDTLRMSLYVGLVFCLVAGMSAKISKMKTISFPPRIFSAIGLEQKHTVVFTVLFVFMFLFPWSWL